MAINRSGTCFSCGNTLNQSDYGRSQSCSTCDSDTKCCKNCEFYDAMISRECREPQADPPQHKDRSNFCELFRPGSPKPTKSSGNKNNAKSAFDALFKKKST